MSPPETSTDDQVRCPHCAATFVLGNAVEISLPKLIRVQQQRQESHVAMYDTMETIPWGLWAELVVDETSIDGTPVEKDHEHIATSEVHIAESEPSDEKPFQTTAAATSENSTTENDEDLFDFVIEGEEASKICSKQELELSEQASSSSEKDPSKFDLTFDEALLEEGKAGPAEQDHDMFDFDAEAGELEPDEFGIQTKERALAQAESSIPKPTDRNRDTVAVAFSRIGHTRRPSQVQLSMIIGTAGLFLLFTFYYTLNFFGGAQFDLLGLYLPGCPHTYGENPELASMQNDTDETVSDLNQSLDQLQNPPSISGADVKPSLPKSITAYRPPIQNNNPAENSTKDPVQNPTYQTTAPTQPQANGLYKHSDLYIPRVTFEREREQFELPEGEVGLATYPLFDVRELEATLKTVHEVFGCPQCQSTGYILSPDGKEKNKCDLCMGEPPNVMSMTCYSYFCQLGQVISLLKDNSIQFKLAKQHVKNLLEKTVTSQQEYHDLAKLVLDRLETPLHNTEGIMIAGFVKFTEPKNGLYVANIILPDSDQRIFVVSDRSFDFLAADEVVLLGTVVLDPVKNITGFPKTSTKPWVIWYGTSAILPETLLE